MNNNQLQQAIDSVQDFINVHVDDKNWSPATMEIARNHLRTLYAVQATRAAMITKPFKENEC